MFRSLKFMISLFPELLYQGVCLWGHERKSECRGLFLSRIREDWTCEELPLLRAFHKQCAVGCYCCGMYGTGHGDRICIKLSGGIVEHNPDQCAVKLEGEEIRSSCLIP